MLDVWGYIKFCINSTVSLSFSDVNLGDIVLQYSPWYSKYYKWLVDIARFERDWGSYFTLGKPGWSFEGGRDEGQTWRIIGGGEEGRETAIK